MNVPSGKAIPEERKQFLTLDKLSVLRQSRSLMALVGLVLLSVMLSIISPYFLTTPNILNILRQVSIIAVMSIGMTLVIITGGIDLAVGSVLALASLVTVLLMKAQVNILISVFAGLAVGAFTGWISGILVVSRFKMPPFISTLAMMSVARGLTMVMTGGMPVFGLPATFAFIGGGYLLGIPVPVIIMILAFALGIFFLSYTRMGLYYYAVGGNEEAARLAGINVGRARLTAYMISGVTAAIGGIILASRITSVEPMMGGGYELDCIAAAVIGGTNMAGGAGALLGTFIGALIMGVLRNGLNLLDVSTYWQQVVIGVVIAVTVAIGTLRKK